MLSCGRLDRANSKTMIEQAIERLWVLGPTALVALVLSFGLMLLLRPWLERYAMVQPNARSSHYQPTPQGGGIAVVIATLVVAWGAVALSPALLHNQTGQFLAVTAATALLVVVGAIDDVRSLPAAARLALQCIAVGAVIAALPNELQILPQVPWSIERACLLLAGIWFVNLVNFMDGIDWMTVAEFVPVTGAIVLLGWLLVQLAAMGHLAAAFILPLYYLADTTITLISRLVRGEAFWQAHRTHFYQRATDCGLTVREIVTRVFLANLALAALALVTVAAHNIVVSLAMLSASAAIILWLLAVLAGVKNRR